MHNVTVAVDTSRYLSFGNEREGEEYKLRQETQGWRLIFKQKLVWRGFLVPFCGFGFCFHVYFFPSKAKSQLIIYNFIPIGIIGGKFLEKGRIKKPGQELFKSEPSEYFKAQDLFIGARVCFHGHNFLLVDADEYTINYMEKHANEVKQALVIFCWLYLTYNIFFRTSYA